MQPGSEGGWPTQLPQGENLFSINQGGKGQNIVLYGCSCKLIRRLHQREQHAEIISATFNMLNTLAGNCTSKRNEDWEKGKELFHFVVTHCLLA